MWPTHISHPGSECEQKPQEWGSISRGPGFVSHEDHCFIPVEMHTYTHKIHMLGKACAVPKTHPHRHTNTCTLAHTHKGLDEEKKKKTKKKMKAKEVEPAVWRDRLCVFMLVCVCVYIKSYDFYFLCIKCSRPFNVFSWGCFVPPLCLIIGVNM